MNGTIVFFSASGEKLADAVGMTGIAPANSEVISVNLSARNVVGAQKDNNALHILTKDNKKLVINDFFSNKKKKLVFDDGKDLFQTDYIAGENFNGLQFKSLSSMDALFDESDTAFLGNDTLSWAVPLIAVAAVSGIAIAVANNKSHKGGDDGEIITTPDADANLIAAKERANKAIDEMTNLTVQQKADAHKAVEDATSVAQVDQVLADTTLLNENSEDTSPSFLDQILQVIDNIAGGVWDVVTAIPKGILSAIKNVVSFISGDNFVTQFIDKVIDFIDSPSSVIKGITELASSVVDTIIDVISDPLGTISNIANSLFDFVTAPFKGIIDTLGSVVDAILHPIDTITKVFNSVVDSVKDFVSDPWGTLFGKSSDSSPAAVKSAFAELAHYSDADADADVVSLSEVPSARMAPEENAAAPVSEEISDVLLSSLLDEGNSNDINLDNIIGEESDLAIAAERAPDSGENIGNTENHDASSEPYAYQPLLNEDNYNLAAA